MSGSSDRVKYAVDVSPFEEAVELHAEIQALEETLKQKKDRKRQLEDQIIETFIGTGVDRMTISGVTVSPRTAIRASAKAGMMPEVCNVLRRLGYDEVVKETVNANTLASIVRGFRDDDGQEVPQELADVINILIDTKVSYRKGQ